MNLDRQQEAFEAYKSAKLKVDRTLSFDDAMMAKRAWSNFLELVDEQARGPSSKIIPFPRRFPDFGGAA